MLKSFLHFIEQERLPLDTGKPVLLAVSGGADSVCLARLMHLGGYAAAIAHVNYGLRGEDSAADARFVEALAAQFGFPFHLLEAVLPEDEIRKTGLQAAARKLRYNWFAALCSQHAYPVLATAHQADDLYETFLLYHRQGRLSAALNALPVMRALDRTQMDGPQLIRPLRFAGRQEIRTWLEEEGQAWREDASNYKPVYARNRLRMSLGSEDVRAEQLREITERQTAFQQQTKAWQAFTAACTAKDGEETLIQTDLVYAAPDGQAWLQWFLRPFGFNEAQCLALWKDGRNAGKTHHGKGGWRIETARGRWFLLRDNNPAWEPIVLQTGVSARVFPFITLTLETNPVNGKERNDRLMAFQFDVPDPKILIRRATPGERMSISGTGSRKINDILADAGIPKHRRPFYPIACYGGNTIAIPGIKRSDAYRLNEETHDNVWWLRVE